MLAKPKITGEYRGEKGILQEETTPSFPRVQLAKDGNGELLLATTLI